LIKMERRYMSKVRWLTALLVAYAMLSSPASASGNYLGGIIAVVCTLVKSFKIMGYSIAIVMFIYGAAKYVYTADDPGGRKQALGVCVAAVMAMLIITAATTIISGIGQMTAATAAEKASMATCGQ
jgi:hypothetical protein